MIISVVYFTEYILGKENLNSSVICRAVIKAGMTKDEDGYVCKEH